MLGPLKLPQYNTAKINTAIISIYTYSTTFVNFQTIYGFLMLVITFLITEASICDSLIKATGTTNDHTASCESLVASRKTSDPVNIAPMFKKKVSPCRLN